MRLIALIAGAAVAVLFTEAAEAKFSCQERGSASEAIVLAGLPARPVAGRTYRLTVTLPDPGPNPTAYLGAQYCGDRGKRVVAGVNGTFHDFGLRRVAAGAAGGTQGGATGPQSLGAPSARLHL